jgi:integrase
MKVYAVMVHGRRRWRLDLTVAGVRRCQVFPSRSLAEAAARDARELESAGIGVLLDMPQAERAAAMAVLAQAREAGVSLGQVWAHWQATGQRTDSPTVAEAVKALADAKAVASRSPRYTDSLRILLGHFTRGREAQRIAAVSHAELEAFLDTRGSSRATYRARLATLFRFALRRGWITSNPVDRLESIRAVARPPAIFTPEQATLALRWLQDHPRALGWFVLSCLCGLRPEEAQATPWASVDLNASLIRVEAQTSKVRQRRVVYPLPSALAWLAEARRLGSDLPIASSAKRRVIRELRNVLGLATWPKDVTRHTAASYWLATVEDAAAVAEQLGHDVATLRRHYRALVTREEAARFWGIRPAHQLL